MLEGQTAPGKLTNENSFSSVIRLATNEKTVQLTRSIAEHLTALENTEVENERIVLRKDLMMNLVSQGLAVGLGHDIGSRETLWDVAEFSTVTGEETPQDAKEVLKRLGMGDVRVYNDNFMAVMPFSPTKEFFGKTTIPQNLLDRIINEPFRPDSPGYLFIGPHISRVFQNNRFLARRGGEKCLRKLTNQLHHPPRENVWNVEPGNGLQNVTSRIIEGPDHIFQANIPRSVSLTDKVIDTAFRESELIYIPPTILSKVVAVGIIDAYRQKGRLWQHANSITPPSK